jgi:hypothetical protein
MGHLNQARFLLGGPNSGAGRPFSLKNDRLGVWARPLDGRPHQCFISQIQDLELSSLIMVCLNVALAESYTLDTQHRLRPQDRQARRRHDRVHTAFPLGDGVS